MLGGGDRYVGTKTPGRRSMAENIQLGLRLVVGGLSLEDSALPWWKCNERVVQFLINVLCPPFSLLRHHSIDCVQECEGEQLP